MNNPIKKIALILVLVILLPAAFFTYYEINSLSESEKVIEETYSKQLDAILFSVNQYSDDVISSWRRDRMNLVLAKEASNPEQLNAKLESFLNVNKFILSIFFADSLQANNTSSLIFDSSLAKFDIKAFLNKNSSIIKKLYTYERGGYNKIEPLENESTDSRTVLVFLLDDPLKLKNICVMVIDPEKYVNNVLGVKIREIAEENFIITCSKINSSELIFSTGDPVNQEIQQKKKLWLIPNYELGILLRDRTIETLVKERAATGLILILALNAILIAGVFIVFRNIKKEMELTRIKSDFVSNVSHELRTPLALISMFAETLEMGRAKTEEKKQEYYSIISKEAGRLSRIVNKILSFSKIEAGKREYRFSDVNINKLTEEIFNSYQFHLHNSGFEFSYNPGEAIPEINADGEAISEAVINLLDNAIKYSSGKKEIIITTGVEKNYVYVEVSDKGIGIREENQKKIFDKFYRVSDGLVYTTKGTGLGLTLVKHIVDAHHGEINVKSKPSEGSKFRLNFPIDKKGNK
jgi:two-component system phosphate regulon sensor histidine kinase PhoR